MRGTGADMKPKIQRFRTVGLVALRGVPGVRRQRRRIVGEDSSLRTASLTAALGYAVVGSDAADKVLRVISDCRSVPRRRAAVFMM